MKHTLPTAAAVLLSATSQAIDDAPPAGVNLADMSPKLKVDHCKSLVLSADQLGRTAQGVADLVAYLKSL